MPSAKADKACPDLGQFQRLVSAQLSDVEKEAVLRHLERCDSCAHKLNTLPEQDTLVELIRQANTLGDEASGKSIARLVQRLSQLRPGKPPARAEQTMPPREAVPSTPLIFACPTCGKGLKVKSEFAGQKVQCPHCKGVTQVRAAAAPTAGRSMADEPQSLPDRLTLRSAYPASSLGHTGDYRVVSAKDRALSDFLAPPQAPDELGRLGPYRVLAVLGAGGMGVVFRAEDPQLARLVALKAMLPALAAGESARQRFLREARAAAAINHDHIVIIYEVGEDRAVPYLAMQFLEGEPLDVRLQREGKLPAAEVLRIGQEIALGLAAAHQRGLIHRDIKPGNLWLESQPGEPGASAQGGRVKILDFGLARAVGDEGQLTQQGAIIGTPAYMAPEQAQGQSVDQRCDLFSLGCVLYRMATGEAPFNGSDMISTLMAVSTYNPPPPRELDGALPTALSELIMRLLAKEAGERPASAQAVAETLEGIARESASGSVPESVRPMKNRKRIGEKVRPALGGRRRWRMALAIIIMLGFGGWLLAAIVFKTKVRTVDGEAFVVLEIEQSGAEVFVDGEKIRVTVPGNNKPLEIQVEPGQHKLRISKDGFVVVTRDVELKIGKSDPIRVRLEPIAKTAQKKAPATVPADALQRGDIPEAVLASLGWGDPKRAPAELVAVLDPGHTREVHSVAFSPDGRWLATGSADNTVRVWDLATGKQRHKLEGHNAPVWSVDFNPTGALLASMSRDGTIALWDSVTGVRVRTLKGHSRDSSVRFSPDGKLVAAGTADGGVLICSARNGEEAQMLQGLHQGLVRCLAFSADGQRLATGGDDGKLVITNLATGTVMQSFKRNSGVNTVEFGVDGKTIAAGYRSPEPVVRLWNLKDKDCVLLKGHTDTVNTVSLRSDGRLAVTTSNDGSVRLWEIGGNLPRKMVLWLSSVGEKLWTGINRNFLAGREDLSLGSVGEKLWTGSLSPDGRYVATGSSNGTTYLFRLPRATENVGEWLAARGIPPPGLPHEWWLERVKGLYVGNVLGAVSDRLRELNPGFDGKMDYKVEDGQVVSLGFGTNSVKDVSPVGALAELRNFHCRGSYFRNGQLTDLTPLKGMKLTGLSCYATQASDLSPLKDMKLTFLQCGYTLVSDLSPLRDIKLTTLLCWHSPVTDAGLMPLQGMSSLRHLQIPGTKITDAGLAHLKKLTSLESLVCGRMKLTGAGLVHLKGMTRLQLLGLFDTEVTDAELVHLKGLLSLRVLNLDRTRVTDAGLEHLTGLKNLTHLSLNGTAVTDNGVAKLKSALPKCHITR